MIAIELNKRLPLNGTVVSNSKSQMNMKKNNEVGFVWWEEKMKKKKNR